MLGETQKWLSTTVVFYQFGKQRKIINDETVMFYILQLQAHLALAIIGAFAHFVLMCIEITYCLASSVFVGFMDFVSFLNLGFIIFCLGFAHTCT